MKKHVKPVASKPAEAPSEIISSGKIRTVTKYTYYESGSSWVKVLLDFENIKDHPREDIEIEFKERSFVLKVKDYKGETYQFAVPKLQCKIKPYQSKLTFKTNNIVVNLKKFKDDDNWWSLFKSKAVGEVDSD